jgi:hypothetical protein
VKKKVRDFPEHQENGTVSPVRTTVLQQTREAPLAGFGRTSWKCCEGGLEVIENIEISHWKLCQGCGAEIVRFQRIDSGETKTISVLVGPERSTEKKTNSFSVLLEEQKPKSPIIVHVDGYRADPVMKKSQSGHRKLRSEVSP